MTRLSKEFSVHPLSNYHALTAFFLAVLVYGSTAGEVVHYQRLTSFGSVTNDGAQPQSPLIEGKDGALYGTTFVGGSTSNGVVFKLNKDGSGHTLLHHFGSTAGDGRKPMAGLLEASDGLLYGTTTIGGTNGLGTIFKMNGDGSGYVIVRSFTLTGSDGRNPRAELVEGSNGVLYGTTDEGGSGNTGTVFAINKDGSNYRILRHFGPGTSTDGSSPAAPLLEGSDGVLYGTTVTGGGEAVGSVFKLNKDGSGYTKLHTFNGSVVNPYAGLIEGSDKALYGTAAGGPGGVFKLNKDGTGYRVLGGFGGALSFGGLVKGRDGAFYGTTYRGGIRPVGSGAGSVFRLNEDGSGFEGLYGFGNSVGDGRNPSAGLVLASDGAFYGTTSAGGDANRGTVFRLLVNRVPVAQCADVVLSADTNSAANASVDNGSFDPDGDPITLSQLPPGPYPLGTNRVTLTVTDSHGDSNSCNAFVIVLDTTPPNITCSSNLIVEFTSEAGAVVTYSVTATDFCDPNPRVTCVPPSGNPFPIGATTVHCAASDASGNSASCLFNVTVLGARGSKQKVLAELIALRDTVVCGRDHGHHDGGNVGDDVCRKLDDAIRHLRASLDPTLWIDETHLDRRHGEQVFHEERKAIEKLCDLIKSRKSDIPDTVLQEFIGRIFRADRLLASVAIQEAITAGASQKKIEQAQKHLAKGDADAGDEKCKNGIEDYSNAWKHAVRAKVSLSPPTHLANGHTQLEILSEPGERITIQASSNLVDWVTIGTGNANAEGVVTFEDADAGRHPVRYYRAVSQ